MHGARVAGMCAMIAVLPVLALPVIAMVAVLRVAVIALGPARQVLLP